jgi:hypothetical protein
MHMRNDGGSTWTGRAPETPAPPRDDGDEDNYGGF